MAQAISEPAPVEHVFFPDGNPVTGEYRDKLFRDLNAHRRVFEKCDFSYSQFVRAYARDAIFKQCRFVGAKFSASNFRGAHFIQCDFSYADFDRSLIATDELVSNLPPAPNQRKELLQNLRANAESVGDYASLRRYVLEEMAASKDHYGRILSGKESYYKEKYKGVIPKVRAARDYVILWLDGFLWGYGEKPVQILLSTLTILALASLINDVPLHGLPGSFWGLKSFEYCVRLFLDLKPDETWGGFPAVDYFIGFYRYIAIGLGASVMYKLISHR